MEIPHENYLAAFPQPRAAGNVTLKPLTLAGAIRLGERGVSLVRRVPRGQLVEAAFVLSGESDLGQFCRRAKFGLTELSRAVEAVLNDAFATYVKPAAPKNARRHLTPHGLGWPLELAEWLCAEYGWSWREALETPVATVHALAAASRQRRGVRNAGMDYLERKYVADAKAGRVAWFSLDSGKEEAV